MLWLALTLLAAGAAALVALPFVRTRALVAGVPLQEAEVLKSQLTELAGDEAAGEVDRASADAMRVEIERRIIATKPAPQSAAAPSPRLDRLTATIVAAIVVLGAVILYSATGRPSLGGLQSASASVASSAQAGQGLPDVDTMIANLAKRLETQPGDAEGWRMLGWSYFETQRFAESVSAYRRAVQVAPNDAGYHSALGEALVSAGNGAVTPEAQREFRSAVSRDPRDERARFFLALGKTQRSDVRSGVNDWIDLVRDAEPDSQWAARARDQAQQAASQNGINIAGRLPPAPDNPSAGIPKLDPQAVAQARSMSPDARSQMIAGMVDGLEERLRREPRDAEGWIRLIRSRKVLNQPDRAAEALRRGLAAFANDSATQQRLRASARELGVGAE